MPHDLNALAVLAARAFLDSTRDLGSKRGPEDGVVSLGWSDLVARPVVFQAVDQPGGGVAVALGMEVTGPVFDRPFRDVSTGMGPTAEVAIKVAVTGFTGGPYAAIHDALSDLATAYRYGITQTNNATGESTQWSIFESPLQIGGVEEAREPLLKLVSTKPLFLRLAESGRLPPLQPTHVHWLMMRAARDEEHPPLYECVFDGGVWADGQELLAGLDWPTINGAKMFRQYWVMTVN